MSRVSTIAALRRMLMAVLVLGVAGTELELLLLKHTDGVWQLIPITLNAITLAVLGWYAIGRGAGALRALQITMLLYVIAGGIGVIQHFRGNIAYAVDSNPSLSGSELYKEAVMGSTPALAPGTMVQLALIGLAFAFRHPRLHGSPEESEST